MRTTQRATTLVAGFAALAIVVGFTPALASQEQQPRQPQARAQAQSIEGQLVSVDAEAKTLTIKPADGAELKIAYNDSTEISGAKDAAGLATMREGRVTVHFTEDAQTKAKLATRIIVQPRQ